DHLCAGCLQLPDHTRVERAAEGPPLSELAERLVVDLHDDHVLRRLLLATDREAAIDAAQLGAAEDVPPGARRDQVAAVGKERQPGRRHSDGQEERDTQPSSACHALNFVREQWPRTTCWSSGWLSVAGGSGSPRPGRARRRRA